MMYYFGRLAGIDGRRRDGVFNARERLPCISNANTQAQRCKSLCAFAFRMPLTCKAMPPDFNLLTFKPAV